MGLNLLPTFTANFAQWVAPLSGGAAAATTNEPQTLFQIQAKPAAGVTEYTIEIDGQQLRYRNTSAQWVNFVWPNPQGAPGARITATKFDGSVVEIVNEPGRFGLERLINRAKRTPNPDGSFDLHWTQSNVTIGLTLRIISNAQSAGAGGTSPSGGGLRNLRLPPSVVGTAPSSVVAAHAGEAP
jgi:type VI secretion system protein ImpL